MSFAMLAKGAATIAAALTPLAWLAGAAHDRPPVREPIAVVRIDPGAFAYRLSGEFDRDGRPVNAPQRATRVERPFAMMKTQVSTALYERCVAARACAPLAHGGPARPDFPAVGVSWRDATAFARWLSRETGEAWRLPTDAEWAFAAGARFKDDALFETDGSFAQRWLAKYDEETALAQSLPAAPQRFGAFGANERGLEDLSGNVWEWTDTCFERQALDAASAPAAPPFANCGVKVVEGAHRAYVSDFIRDARAGGCSVGAPPSHLGFRLVRDEPGLVAAAIRLLRRADKRG